MRARRRNTTFGGCGGRRRLYWPGDRAIEGAELSVEKNMRLPGRWEKLGQIYCPQPVHPKLLTHAANPIPLLLEGDVFRVLFSGRDASNRSSVGAVDLNLRSGAVVRVHPRPLFEHGPQGSFYADGVSLGN